MSTDAKKKGIIRISTNISRFLPINIDIDLKEANESEDEELSDKSNKIYARTRSTNANDA